MQQKLIDKIFLNESIKNDNKSIYTNNNNQHCSSKSIDIKENDIEGNMKKYVASYKDLGFDESFVKEAKEQLKRFAKEIPFRREEEEAARKLEEERLAKKNKKKGKK